ncbi:hypothetical protein NQ315_006266 [Exocentrus adspersus]|uniref:Pleckstrin homology domain-containing family G member 1 n=1 Tax=Exocentrus adspersus TaxID=1586481 RepID=A0AAV8VZF6_9CUCU|nr:hypothetical protein NQ315_006266 [Exocentrus adspersus]
MRRENGSIRLLLLLYWEGHVEGSSPELMPSIMGAFDAIIATQLSHKDAEAEIKTSTPRRSHQAGNFAHLSPCVQKILSHVPDQEITKKFNSEETLASKRLGHNRPTYRSFRSPDKSLNKSTENLDIISSNVQKMLSNLPDTELVISASNLNLTRNSSYLFSSGRGEFSNKSDGNGGGGKQFLYHSEEGGGVVDACEQERSCDSENCDSYSQQPLGSYLHSTHGIASRTPVGRKNLGKFLQVPSESSVGNGSSSTASSEVSRPVSLTSLGSCSSSGSSGHHQPGSAYLASAESLDSDPEPNGSQGSADSGIAEQEQPSVSPELRVLQEVLETEAAYVTGLQEVIQGYLEPWRADPECPLAQHLQHLFSNLEEIYEFNRSFLEDLKKANCVATKTANCFLQHHSGFALLYNEYCTSYPRTMEVLGQLTRDEEMAPLFRERQLALGHALPLGSYLLKPVQRILKYHLLLQRLSKQCEPDHKPTVDLALTTMTGIASDINDMKRKHEHAVRVQEIQSQLYGWSGPDLTALGELIAEGTFRVAGARGRRHVFLFDKVLLLAKSKQDGALAYKCHIMCSNLMLVEQVRGEPLSFHVLPFDNPRLQCTLKARSPQHKREWTLQIKRVILENYSVAIPNHAMELVLKLGQDLSVTEDTTDKWSPLRQYSTPHYLERRCRVRKTRDFTNRRASSQDRSFPSLGNWRRKSEPGMIPQYNSKLMPKKIAKIKKTKECSSARFYTDLSDSETCDVVGESMESLPQNLNEDTTSEQTEQEQPSPEVIKNNLEKIVSEILMQNQNFQKALCRHNNRKNVTSDPTTSVWYEDRPNLPSKADSLPRSFQLNDNHNSDDGKETEKNEDSIQDMSLKENSVTSLEELHENDLSSQIDDSEHPEHKIYRKSVIRFSIVQRVRQLLSEEQKRYQKYPVHKQGSEAMGEKIANPDYVDPQKLFLGSRNCSQINLSVDSNDVESELGEPERLDLSINEKDVLNELEKRLKSVELDTGQQLPVDGSSQGSKKLNSSQNSDNFYESILEDSLTEEYVRDANGKLVVKQDSFNNNDGGALYAWKYKKSTKPIIKRPTKAPPPIPTKPSRLVNSVPSVRRSTSTETIRNSSNISCNRTFMSNGNTAVENGAQRSIATSTSWVKTMVGRFE